MRRSYKRKSRPLYNVKHLPQLNVSFRNSWDKGLEQALGEIANLRNNGWAVDVDRGALTENQASMLVRVAERMGNEVKTVPVAKWGEDQIQFVAYKPKPGQESAAPIVTVQPKKTRTRKERDPTEAFQKVFWKSHKEPEEPDGGVLLNPSRTLAVVPKNASPQEEGKKNMVKLVAETVHQPEKVEQLDYNRFVKAERTGKTQQKQPHYVSFGSSESCYSIDLIKKAMRVLGTKKHAKAYYREDKPLVVRNEDSEHSIIIAPSAEPASSDKVITLTTVQAM